MKQGSRTVQQQEGSFTLDVAIVCDTCGRFGTHLSYVHGIEIPN